MITGIISHPQFQIFNSTPTIIMSTPLSPSSPLYLPSPSISSIISPPLAPSPLSLDLLHYIPTPCPLLPLLTLSLDLLHYIPTPCPLLPLLTLSLSSPPPLPPQELQSTRGVDPQPEYYIDQIAQMTTVSMYM